MTSASQPRIEPGEPVGLVAGWGRFPMEVAEALSDRGHPVDCVAIRGHAGEELGSVCRDIRWSGVGKLGGHLRYFRRRGIRHVTMAGKLFKADLLYRGSLWLKHLPDWTCIRTFAPHLLGRRRDARDDNLLLAVMQAYAQAGLTVVPATEFAPQLLVERGTLAGREPPPNVRRDIALGWQVAKQMGALDIGQSITIKDGTVIAVEAIEGTDACLARTGELCPRGGWTLVKVSKPNQDMRFDVPTIGENTVARASAAGGVAIAIEAAKTILVDRQRTLAGADRAGIAIVAVDPADLDPEWGQVPPIEHPQRTTCHAPQFPPQSRPHATAGEAESVPRITRETRRRFSRDRDGDDPDRLAG